MIFGFGFSCFGGPIQHNPYHPYIWPILHPALAYPAHTSTPFWYSTFLANILRFPIIHVSSFNWMFTSYLLVSYTHFHSQLELRSFSLRMCRHFFTILFLILTHSNILSQFSSTRKIHGVLIKQTSTLDISNQGALHDSIIIFCNFPMFKLNQITSNAWKILDWLKRLVHNFVELGPIVFSTQLKRPKRRVQVIYIYIGKLF